MKKQRSSFVCQQCGYETAQWYGKCPNCGTWNSLVETVKQPEAGAGKGAGGSFRRTAVQPVRLSDVRHIETQRLKSGFGEFDRVMGGGIVPGSVALLSGDPGIGKSTLLLHVLGHVGGLYISGEESAEQVKLRAERLGIKGTSIIILPETNVEGIVQAIGATERLPLVIVDSIQTLSSDNLDGMAGSVGQIRYSAEQLVGLAKDKGIPMIIIGHVTKEGTIAGPKILEHMVDTVLYLEGERFASARVLRTLKNRFGAVEEVGIFDMQGEGLKEVDNPSALFLQDRVQNVPGSIVTVIMEGTRPMLVEIQALTVPTQLAIPRRVANGFDFNRLQLILAILQKRLNLPLGSVDVFVNVSGGMKVSEPGADLAVALAVVSSFKNKAIAADVAVFGEVGLLGEVRAIGSGERRMKEAQRLGFKTVVAPPKIQNLTAAAKFIQ